MFDLAGSATVVSLLHLPGRAVESHTMSLSLNQTHRQENTAGHSPQAVPDVQVAANRSVHVIQELLPTARSTFWANRGVKFATYALVASLKSSLGG